MPEIPDPSYDDHAEYNWFSTLPSGVREWVLSAGGVFRALFLPTGLLDWRPLSANPQPPPTGRVRMSIVDGQIALTDQAGVTVLFGATAVDEVVLTFPDTLAPGTAFNIKTGVYGGGGPATVEGDQIDLPATGALFAADGKFTVHWNGQLLKKGASGGAAEANWASSVQLSLSSRIRPGNEITVRRVR